MEYRRALADLEEVRDRLAACQRFRGYSGPAAVASGAVAVAAGIVQVALAPSPHSPSDERTYLALWLACLGVALALNYGALAMWYVRAAARHERSGARGAGVTLLPAIGLGAVLTIALVIHGAVWMLPGVWYACYAVGLAASRAMVPASTQPVAALFGIAGMLLLLWPNISLPLSWWVMPIGFGAGQIAIGLMLVRDAAAEAKR